MTCPLEDLLKTGSLSTFLDLRVVVQILKSNMHTSDLQKVSRRGSLFSRVKLLVALSLFRGFPVMVSGHCSPSSAWLLSTRKILLHWQEIDVRAPVAGEGVKPLFSCPTYSRATSRHSSLHPTLPRTTISEGPRWLLSAPVPDELSRYCPHRSITGTRLDQISCPRVFHLSANLSTSSPRHWRLLQIMEGNASETCGTKGSL